MALRSQATVLLFLLLLGIKLASAQTVRPNPCDEPTYKRLLLSGTETLTQADRVYMASAGYACAEYLRAFEVFRSYGMTSRPPKDPDIALAIAVPFPGGGHIYSGEHAKGFGIYLTTLLAPSLGFLASQCAVDVDDCEPGFLWGGLAVSALTWFVSILDAPVAAARANARAVAAVRK